jgi:hypothetical protein
MINIRHAFIEKCTNIITGCNLFKTKALYPKRFFDDLMIEDTLLGSDNYFVDTNRAYASELLKQSKRLQKEENQLEEV